MIVTVTLAEALQLEVFSGARLVAGDKGLGRELKWAHVVDIPDPFPWVRPGQLLLTTGYAWPREDDALRRLIRRLNECGLSGVGLAVPQFFEHFPESACEEAKHLGLPLLEIPWEVPFALITEEVHRVILAEQYAIIERSEDIHRVLTRAAIGAESLQQIAETLGRLLQRDVTFEDPEGVLLAHYTADRLSGLDTDPVRQATLETGATPPEVWHVLEAEGYLSRIKRSNTPVHIPSLPQLGLKPRVVCPIRVKGELVGLVWIIEGDTPLDELDLRAAEHAATIAALHITHQRALAQQETRLGYSFLDALLEGRFEPTPHNLERARLMGFDLEASYRVWVLVLEEGVPLSREGFMRREDLSVRVRRRLGDLGLKPLVTVTLNRVIGLLTETVDPSQLWKVISSPNLVMLVGRSHSGPEGVARSYREALSLLPLATPGQLYLYESWLIPRVLLGDPDAREALVQSLFGALWPRRGGEALVQTLVTWARCGFRQKEAACELNVHLNTLRYRLERVESLLGRDLSDPQTRFEIRLATEILLTTHKKYT